MNQDQLKEYKAKLEEERGSIVKDIKDEKQPVDFGSDIDHEEEEIDKTEEEGNRMAVAQDLQTRLNEIDIALEKIRTGEYGVCEQCGAQIEREVLDIDPESRFCKKDKTHK